MPITQGMDALLGKKTTFQYIQNEKKLHTIEAIPQAPKFRVGAYCRVSTDSEQQEGSLIAQREHFLSIIERNHDLEFIDIYYEKGISGTKKETRPELKRLLKDCRSGKVNLVLTKSISRFARNTMDCLEMVRELTSLGIHVVFEKEQIDTRLVESEFIMTILASLAEEESHSFSDNNRWSIQKRFQNGTYRPATAPYGYDLTDGQLVINANEALIVKEMYARYLSGEGSSKIAMDLNDRGVMTKRNGQVWQGEKQSFAWDSATVLGVLQNIDYVGDAILQQTYHDRTFKLCNNKGEMPQYYIQDRHPAIITRETFERVQILLEQRRKEAGSCDVKKKQHLLSGRVYCSWCGSLMTRTSRRKGVPNRFQWMCARHHRDPLSCGAQSVMENNLLNCWETMLNKLRYADSLLKCYAEGLKQEWREARAHEIIPLEERLKEISSEKAVLQRQWSDGSIEGKEYFTERNRLATEERIVQTDLARIACQAADEVQRFQDAIRNHMDSEKMFTLFVEKIVCTDRFTYVFHLTCGLKLKEETDIKDYSNYGRVPERKKP